MYYNVIKIHASKENGRSNQYNVEACEHKIVFVLAFNDISQIHSFVLNAKPLCTLQI